MRKLVLGFALASTAMATPALARNDSWYVEADGGAMILENSEATIGGVENAATLDNKTGYDFGGIVGYDFGGFRLESEVGYRSAQNDSLTVGNTTFNRDDDTLRGHARALSYMVNGLLDFGDDDGLQGFIGGGVGVANVKYHIIKSFGGVDDSDTNFAWQAIAGVRAPLSKHWDVGLKYRFFNVNNVKLTGNYALAGVPVETRFRSHSLLGTLAYNFGGAEPM
uniref:outer membrane protein n=2 Tax=Novosphingobium TaxID=165696 RepID=UPI0038BDE955